MAQPPDEPAGRAVKVTRQLLASRGRPGSSLLGIHPVSPVPTDHLPGSRASPCRRPPTGRRTARPDNRPRAHRGLDPASHGPASTQVRTTLSVSRRTTAPPGQGSGGYGGPGPMPPTRWTAAVGQSQVAVHRAGCPGRACSSSAAGSASTRWRPAGARTREARLRRMRGRPRSPPTRSRPGIFPPTLPTDDLPSDLLTDLPTDLTDLPDMPTEGGPSEEQYVDVATGFAEAVRDGDCDEAREYANDAFNDSVSDENLCEGTTQAALKDDDFDDYEIEFFGTYGALVTFDGGQTNISLVVSGERRPPGAVLHRLLTAERGCRGSDADGEHHRTVGEDTEQCRSDP